MRRKIWQVKKSDTQIVSTLAKALNLAETTATILVNRGLTTPLEARDFLQTSWQDLQDPYLLPEMSVGIARIKAALENQEQILIYGDYDVDGITSTVLLVDLLTRLGGQVAYYLPDRKEEGYGLNKEALLKAKSQGINLIITVDCGSTSLEEAQLAYELAMDLVITDHHQLGEELPLAKAVINPQRIAEKHPWSNLAGVGVAFKVGQALAQEFSQPQLCQEYLGLVALGTIADLVPLWDENRILVKAGLEQIRRGKCCLGLRALIKSANLSRETISVGQVSFVLAPRLNACGRLGQADEAVRLFLSEDLAEIEALCLQLANQNRQRQELEEEIYREAVSLWEKEGCKDEHLIFLAAPNWHPGVIGIVASRLVEKYYRPVILLTIEEGIARGSGRSIAGFNLYQALAEVKGDLLSFGGHEMAAGLTLAEENISQVKKKLREYAAAVLDEEKLTPLISIDAEINEVAINEHLVNELEYLAPFGCGNPTPLLTLRKARLKKIQLVGQNEAHLKLWLEKQAKEFTGIGFRMGKRAAELTLGQEYDFVFRLQLNTFCGKTQLQLVLTDFKPHWQPDNPFNLVHLEERRRQVILGGADFYEKQSEALSFLDQDKNTLLVLGTGRGKSAVFQTHAASLAWNKKKISIFIYPLRSLVNDQYQRIHKKMALLGLKVSRAQGALNLGKRKQFFCDLEQGKIDMILTTPEFLYFHLDKFKQCASRMGFFVIDEAHHLAKSNRLGYCQLAHCWQELNKPLVLAATATAAVETAQLITKIFAPMQMVTENYCRENLQIIDQRRQKDKLKYLLKLIDSGERIIIYMNSRRRVYQLAEKLRFYHQGLKEKIGFYHAGLNNKERFCLEKSYRQGELQVMVTTSAFGEGIDIPDIRHVVLYHLPFSYGEFNQLAGRAGRNHESAYIHLLFNEADRALNEFILQRGAPSRAVLAKVYLFLLKQAPLKRPWSEVIRNLPVEMHKQGIKYFSSATTATALVILEELGLLACEDMKSCTLLPAPSEKLDLAISLCYSEGKDEWEEFQDFANFALTMDKEVVLKMINQPIFPQARESL